MSSNEDDFHDGESGGTLGQGSKKRRIQRACDICRRKKIRCDGVHMPGNRCSNCITYNFECSYIEAAKKRGPPKGYVESLENRVEKLEKLLKRLCPDENVLQQLNTALEKDNWLFEQPPEDPSPLTSQPCVDPSTSFPEDPIKTVTSAFRNADNVTPEAIRTDDDDDSSLILADNLKKLAIDPEEYRFFGKSSGAMLIQTAIELKNEYTQSDMVISDLHKPALTQKRADFWTMRPWEREARNRRPPPYEFPEPDLASSLVDIYFEYVNLYLPLLHEPTFRREVEQGLHRENESFAATYLLVCAVASRFTDDPRVLVSGVENRHSAGWKWFDQVQMVRKSLLSPPSLYDLQFYCLAVQFLQGSSAPQSCWTMVGIGIRLAQDVGAHRRKVHQREMTPEDELWKRAFWVLVCMDRTVSAALGRPCAIQDEDFDLDFPIECDDEYWEHPDPEQRFKQPPGKPSLMTAFRLLLKLNQVLAFSLRTIYSINKSKILLGLVGQQWEQHIVAELDSALNKWVDSVPDHLRWDPNREDDKFFNQSVTLYAAYYHIQILIHRPFIPSPSKHPPYPSRHSQYAQMLRVPAAMWLISSVAETACHPPQIQMASFTSGIVLLLSIWGGKRSGLTIDPNKEMADVHKCMQMLKSSESRWHSAGRLWDILYELASVGDLPLPQSTPPSNLKRDREEETNAAASTSPTPGTAIPPTDGARSIAGSKRFNKDAKPNQPRIDTSSNATGLVASTPCASSSVSGSIHPSPQPAEPRPQEYDLPVYSDDLGRLPLHGQVTFNSQPLPPAPTPSGPSGGGDHHLYWHSTRNPSARPDPMSLLSSPSNAMQGVQNQFQQYMTPRSAHQHGGGGAGDGFGQGGAGTIGGHVGASYDMDPATMAAGMMFDTMAASLGYPSASYTMAMGGAGGGGGGGGGQVPSGDQPHGYRMPMTFRPDMADSTQAGQGQNSYPYVNSDMVAMWSNAPSAFELDEWGTYIDNVSELAQNPAGAGGPSAPHPNPAGNGSGSPTGNLRHGDDTLRGMGPRR